VDSFLKDLDDLDNKANLKDPVKNSRIPMIMAHNAFVRETFLNVKQNSIDPIVGYQ
jgi:hypothetical protein